MKKEIIKKALLASGTCAVLLLGIVPLVYASGTTEAVQIIEQEKTVTGTVIAPNGEPVIGANVIQKGT